MRLSFIITILAFTISFAFLAVTYMASQAVVVVIENNQSIHIIEDWYNISHLSFMGAVGSALVGCFALAWPLSSIVTKIISVSDKQSESK